LLTRESKREQQGIAEGSKQMYAAVATIEETKGDVTKGGYPVDGLSTAYRGITAVGSRKVVLSVSFTTLACDFGLQRLPEREVRPC
jgi:hypothetical protein